MLAARLCNAPTDRSLSWFPHLEIAPVPQVLHLMVSFKNHQILLLGHAIGHANHHSQGRQLLQHLLSPTHHTHHKYQYWEVVFPIIILIFLFVPELITDVLKLLLLPASASASVVLSLPYIAGTNQPCGW